MEMTPLTRVVLAGAMNLALASLVVAAIGLLLVRTVRRSAPLRHGFALGTLGLLLLLPATPFAATLINTHWVPQVSLVQWPVASASQVAAPLSAPTARRATGSASASGLRTLTADEIPSRAILPGQSSKSPPAGIERRGLTPPLNARFNVVAAGLAIVALWLLGTLVSLLLTLRGALRVTRLVQTSPPVSDLAVVSLFDQLANQLRLRCAPGLRSTASVGVPFAWGLYRPVIVLPQPLADAANVAQLCPMLLHELAHVRRRDVWIGLLQRIAAAMYWWNPLVHQLNSRLAEAREQICDAHVLAGGCPPCEYAELLVDLAARITLPQPAAPALLSRSEPQLTRRVQHLLEDPPMFTSLRWFAKLALIAFIFVGATATVMVAAVIVNERRMSTLTVIPDRQVNRAYVGGTPIRGSRPRSAPVAVTQPAAQTFVAPEPIGGDIANSIPQSPVVVPAPLHDPYLQPVQPMRRDRGAPTATILPDTAFAAGNEEDLGEGTALAAPPPVPNVTFNPATPVFGPIGEPDARVQLIGQGSIHGLAVIELVGNNDGTLKDIRWFTESLGNDSEAATKLTERLTAFASAQPTTVYRLEPRTIVDASGQKRTTYVRVTMQMNAATSAAAGFQPYEPVGPVEPVKPMPAQPDPALQRVLAAQITASPQLRYEHVAKAVALCEPHVQRVIIGQSDVTPELTLTLGFVRDGAGKKISSSPVLIWNDAVVSVPETVQSTDAETAMRERRTIEDKIVEVHSLPPLLLNWRAAAPADSHVAHTTNLTARIRADDGVDPKLVEQVVQAILPAGFERVVLEPLGTLAEEDVQAVVTEVNESGDGRRFTISIGTDDGVRVGSVLKYRPLPAFRRTAEGRSSSSGSTEEGTLEVIAVGPDHAECILRDGFPAPEVGTVVQMQMRPPETPLAVEPANPEPLPTY